MQPVLIEATADGGGTYCHRDGCSDTSSYAGAVCSSNVADFVAIGRLSGLLEGGQNGPWGCVNCLELCTLVERVLEYTEKEITVARGQLEDVGVDQAKRSDFEVAYLDLLVRDVLAEEARSTDDPFKQGSQFVDHVLDMYLSGREKTDADA